LGEVAVVPFKLNVLSHDEGRTTLDGARQLNSDARHYVAHIVSAFQGYLARDADPNAEEGVDDGILFGLTASKANSSDPIGSLIYLETGRDANVAPAIIVNHERFTVAHEVGHQFVAEEWHGADDPPGSGTYIMTTAPRSIFSDHLWYSPTTLDIIRSAEKPQP
jgi:hypothetical protein